MTPLVTIFSAPKPFEGGHIELIQRNAIRSWKALGVDSAVALIGDEPGIRLTAADLGVHHLAAVKTNTEGTPLISSIFSLGRSLNESPLLAYVNADVILLNDFLESARQVIEIAERFLIVGQRYDLDLRAPLELTNDWEKEIREDLQKRGRLHPPMGSDFFIFPRLCFQHIPDFAVGRAGWDNWMIYKGRREGWKVVDATGSITVIHQDHDYGHLPGGKPHYRLPESDENVRLAGGKRTIFHLEDCSQLLQNGRLESPKPTWKRAARETETFPLRKLHSNFLAQVSFAVFHPVKAYREIRPKLGGMQKSTVRAEKEI
jgi:hypothetical protein